ncbi:chemotaxis protein CheW [Rugamonas sp. CCM 8940]|uniref:chemotaxis protein CheW n=1 Tax=Rugamonas sp. CCM 8940 TaxID=2765359 RepID=UPI0018F72170|nr:chemotaxis protein CheW [Rugamonas sp. CCM 8940]MBJ7310557.1 chemotaxis protein CheW [Rugamonas sp. CCM 8940]
MSASGRDPVTAPDGAERRSRLRQYQVQLLERMQAAASGAVVGGRELGVQLGGRRFLLDLTQISEIAPPQALTAVPLAQPWYLGLANLRGALSGVVDLARYLDIGAVAAGPQARLVSFAPGLGCPCALLVEQVLGLRRLDQLEPAEAPEVSDAAGDADAAGRGGAAPAAPWCSQYFRERDGAHWTRLDLALLLREPRFLQVGL